MTTGASAALSARSSDGAARVASPGSDIPAAAVPDDVLDLAVTDLRAGRMRAAIEAVVPYAQAVGEHAEGRVLLAGAILVECHLATGDLPAAAAVVAALPLEAEPPAAAWAEYARGELRAALGEVDPAVEHYVAAGAAGGDDAVPSPPWRAGLALALLRLGRLGEARSLAEAQHARALESGDSLLVAHALRTLATVEPGSTRIAVLRQARAIALAGDARRLRAQIDADLAGLLVLTGEADEALDLLRDVEAYAAREHLWPLHSRVRRLLERVGAAPRRLEAEALALLTAAERRVAVLALEGHPNRVIADRLAISVKAVEGHLSRIYRKLGVRSRAGLLAAVAS